ncbi:MAG: transketolase [Candidatus Marinimicrobia bacterium]|nr:transketolase [Candidatus Neomarinimicrobiota bacterium]
MNTILAHKKDLHHWQAAADMADQCIDIALNLSQSGHPGGSRSKIPVLITTLLSGVMKWDIRNPGATFGDRFVLVAGHTNPAVYAVLAVFNEALRRKFNATGDEKYLNPHGEEFTLHWEDLLTLRRRGGLPGHAEMEGKTLFFKFNTGPTGHGAAPATGQAFALKYAGSPSSKVFAFEGEGGLTAGVSHEARIAAYGLGLGNLIYVVDWNDFGIDDRPFSSIKYGIPEDWFGSYGWKTSGTDSGEDLSAILDAYAALFAEDTPLQPKALWVKTRKGRGYGKYDNASHGAPHKRNSTEFWQTKKIFAEKYGVNFRHMDVPAADAFASNREMMADSLEEVMSLFDKQEGLADYLANRLLEIANSIPVWDSSSAFEKNPMHDPAITDYKRYPAELYKQSGEKAPNREAFGNFGSWLNSYSQLHYGRPLALVCSADLAGSTNIAGFSKGFDNHPDFGMYDPQSNAEGTLLPQGITEFANAGITTGISTVNFAQKPYEEFNGFITSCSTYGSFSYLKYGAYRLFSQIAQDSQLKVGKTIWVAGHSGPETAEDFRTHFGIHAPGVTQLFPEGHILNLHPWEYNEVPVMLGAALATDIPIIALHLTRPPIEIPNRQVLGMASHFEAAKGAYIIKDYDDDRKREGVILVRGTSVINELCAYLPELIKEGPNVKIVAALSWGLFMQQEAAYQKSIMSDTEWLDCMVITNTSLNNMSHWVQHPIVKHYSLSADWDNNWRAGGNLEEVIEEAHLSKDWQIKAITRFAENREKRMQTLQSCISPDVYDTIEVRT